MNDQSGGMMAIVRQRTLKNSIHCSGVGLHTGAKVSMTLRPASPGSGIVFRRVDLGPGAEAKATWRNAVETPLCTTLVAKGGIKLAITIEHLMSAFYGCGIDNAIVELDADEVPIMDGSAAPFVFLIDCAGTTEQNAPRRAVRVLKHVGVTEPHRSASLTPGGPLTVNFEIDFESSVIARQECFTRVNEVMYKREIARARTFGFLHEVDKLRAMGLARGGSLDNAIVISGDRILNEGGLRFENEFDRHKVLDSIGDLYLAGAPILGHFHGIRAGHALTVRLLKRLFADDAAWCWAEPEEEAVAYAPVGLAAAGGQPARAVAASA